VSFSRLAFNSHVYHLVSLVHLSAIRVPPTSSLQRKGKKKHTGKNQVFLWPFIDLPPSSSRPQSRFIIIIITSSFFIIILLEFSVVNLIFLGFYTKIILDPCCFFFPLHMLDMFVIVFFPKRCKKKNDEKKQKLVRLLLLFLVSPFPGYWIQIVMFLTEECLWVLFYFLFYFFSIFD